MNENEEVKYKIDSDEQIKSNNAHLTAIVRRLNEKKIELLIQLLKKFIDSKGGSLLDENHYLELQRRALLEEIEKLEKNCNEIGEAFNC